MIVRVEQSVGKERNQWFSIRVVFGYHVEGKGDQRQEHGHIFFLDVLASIDRSQHGLSSGAKFIMVESRMDRQAGITSSIISHLIHEF